jgi:CRP/FNR family cyclic AMP-dependent transcriptional regulator
METLAPLLAQHPFLQGLTEEHIALITGCGSNVRFDAETYLFHEGDEANQFFIIRSGRIAVEVFTPGMGPVTVQTLSDGDVLGWSWLFPPYRWHFTARTLELTRAIALDGKCLRTKCESDHHLGYELLKRFSRIIEERLQAMRLQLMDIYGEATK